MESADALLLSPVHSRCMNTSFSYLKFQPTAKITLRSMNMDWFIGVEGPYIALQLLTRV